MFGRGGVPHEGLKFTRQVLSQDVIQEFLGFLHRDDISRPSSCRSVLVDDVETPVCYWKHSLKDIIQQYLVEFPSGVKKSFIYSHLPTNFRMDTMLAGLCNICDDCGHTNFDNMETEIEEIGESTNLDVKGVSQQLRQYQRFLKTKYACQVCKSLCIRIMWPRLHKLSLCSNVLFSTKALLRTLTNKLLLLR